MTAQSAFAQDADLCSDRPGKATPACVADDGTVQVETSIADWSESTGPNARSDDILFGDTLVKLGIGNAVELRASFTAYEHDRERTATGISIAGGFGDVGLSARWRAVDGGDRAVSIAVQPQVTLPVGDRAVSDGTWSAALTVPIDLPLSDAVTFNLSPMVEAAADGDRRGRHIAYGTTAALSWQPVAAVTLGGELWTLHDEDPAGRTTQVSADLLLAWQPARNWQLDLSTYAGLNRDTPDIALVGGFTRRF